jgi:hypothetical protein
MTLTTREQGDLVDALNFSILSYKETKAYVGASEHLTTKPFDKIINRYQELLIKVQSQTVNNETQR